MCRYIEETICSLQSSCAEQRCIRSCIVYSRRLDLASRMLRVQHHAAALRLGHKAPQRLPCPSSLSHVERGVAHLLAPSQAPPALTPSARRLLRSSSSWRSRCHNNDNNPSTFKSGHPREKPNALFPRSPQPPPRRWPIHPLVGSS